MVANALIASTGEVIPYIAEKDLPGGIALTWAYLGGTLKRTRANRANLDVPLSPEGAPVYDTNFVTLGGANRFNLNVAMPATGSFFCVARSAGQTASGRMFSNWKAAAGSDPARGSILFFTNDNLAAITYREGGASQTDSFTGARMTAQAGKRGLFQIYEMALTPTTLTLFNHSAGATQSYARTDTVASDSPVRIGNRSDGATSATVDMAFAAIYPGDVTAVRADILAFIRSEMAIELPGGSL